MSLKACKVLTSDVVGTLIDFERGMLDELQRLRHAIAPALGLAELADAVEKGL